MAAKFNLQGSERKPLVKAIEELTGRKGKYCMGGAMKYAYDFGDGLELHRDGTLKGETGELLAQLADKGFTPETDEAEAYAEHEMHRMKLEAENIPDYSNRGQYGGDEIPIDWEDGMTEEEELGLGHTRREDFQGENGMQADDAPDVDESDILTVEFPLAGFTPQTLDNLTKIVAAREALIKAALGSDDLPIQVTEETVRFPWFTLNNPSESASYTQFIAALCKMAMAKKRVTAKDRGLTGNPKYVMRCWLLSLGLIGDEFRNARKLLLSKLDGNCSFKGGARPTYTAHCYTHPIGSEEDAMDCETFEFTSLSKAKAFCDGFARDCESLKHAGCHVEDDAGNYLYEILADGTVSMQ